MNKDSIRYIIYSPEFPVSAESEKEEESALMMVRSFLFLLPLRGMKTQRLRRPLLNH